MKAELRRWVSVIQLSMAETKPKNLGGRPAVPEEKRLIFHPIRLTMAQIQKLALLGGPAWLRKQIDKAKVADK